ncbi:FAD-dependent monooxygenase [Planomonospora venezuelensis]|uniref:2-polyprenyl-6-methoxyphenol hydroxylase-like FAD-dependent oxidoreductase n=1 Tax=Planomonospora venezuelensis TaxID=1999 RepID=A0A841CZL0_PLAVE|nr:FAD-dependent monooxygenase [Planomonospora venezuelensis]MBB5961427.1 2-polyprenyl-6-methoxyphenol hydroxylase-like FAD-dependent oxidoreductase [Planomonospora venezuelensis]GIN03173.1 FAD-dependent oxidoreductase [Planomonospora venezuelensis]
MKNTNVLVSGAGIAGVSLAFWLRRSGFTVTVVERAPEIRAGGYKIDIRGAALQVIERMGVLEEVRAMRTEVRSGSVVNAAGRRVASMDGDTFGGREHGDAEVLRGDLHRLLYGRTQDGVEYRFGDSVTSLDDTSEGVRATFGSGRTEVFDLVVGADGMRSATRALAFGPDERFVRDMGYYVSVFTVPNHLGLDREELTYVGPGRTALTYSTAREAGAKAMFLFASEPLSYDHRDRAEQERLLAAAYAGEGWEVPRLLRGVGDSPDFLFDSLGQVHMNRWSAGRAVLIGDAAHCASPASGQGTSLALVGAYVLAAELAAAGGDHAAAFDAYERRMRPFVHENQKLGPANIKRMVLRSRGQVRFSMAMLGLMARVPGRDRLLAKIMEPLGRAANAITLPQ